MNRNRHMQYRRSVYRKRRIRTVVITAVVVIALLVALFLIIGNKLFDKTKDEEETVKRPSEETKDFSVPADNARHIKGRALPLSGGAGEIFSSLDKAKESGYGELSLVMNDESGALYYRSEMAEELGLTLAYADAVSVSELLSEIKSRELYISGIYYISAFSVEDELLRSVEMSRTAAVISEVLRAGADEVVLVAPDISVEQIGEVTHLISEIRSFVPDATIGFSLPEALVASADAEVIDALAADIGFLALDLTRYGENDPLVFAQERIGAMHYSLLRYKMRVIVPNTDGEIKAKIISEVENAGVLNWQER